MHVPVPLRYATFQVPVIGTMFGLGARNAIPQLRPRANPTRFEPVTFEVAPLPRDLVDRYVAWTGASPSRYPDTIPPHLVCQWGMGAFSRLTARSRYDVLSVLNQGCTIRENRPLPRDEPFHVRAVTVAIDEEPHRIRIHNRLVAGTASHPESLVVDSLAAVPTTGRAKAAPGAPRAEPTWRSVGRWSADTRTGLDFALLTGDFNPIHWLRPVARRTRFRGCIMHGFGTLARTYETFRNAGTELVGVDARFVRPLPFPHDGVEVEAADGTAGELPFRVRGGDGTVFVAGTMLLPQGRSHG